MAGNGGRRWLEVVRGGIRIKMVIKYLNPNPIQRISDRVRVYPNPNFCN